MKNLFKAIGSFSMIRDLSFKAKPKTLAYLNIKSQGIRDEGFNPEQKNFVEI
ncbi:MAG: hypothetical protein NTX25_06410 [Proteobacteria bacterium]|nr:hypothetical protein [Pseudomonadota bacterium]